MRRLLAHILLMKRSLFMALLFFPPDEVGTSVHISLTFSSTILQCRSKALTRAKSFRLLRHEMSTCVCERTAVCKIDNGPAVNSCSSICDISNSVRSFRGLLISSLVSDVSVKCSCVADGSIMMDALDLVCHGHRCVCL